MQLFIKIMFLMSLFSTLGVLVFGLFCYFKGGSFNNRYGNRAMRWRIMLQAVTLLLFLFLLTIRH